MNRLTLKRAAGVLGVVLALGALASSYVVVTHTLFGLRKTLAWLAPDARSTPSPTSSPNQASRELCTEHTPCAAPSYDALEVTAPSQPSDESKALGSDDEPSHLLPGETEGERAMRVATEKDPGVAALLDDPDPAVRNAMLDFFVEDEVER